VISRSRACWLGLILLSCWLLAAPCWGARPGGAALIEGETYRLVAVWDPAVPWGQLDHPADTAVDSQGEVYVSDEHNHRIQVFDATGAVVRSWGHLGNGAGELWHPRGVAISPDGRVYVADCYNHRIQIFDRQGNYINAFGRRGGSDGQFLYPCDLTFDNAGHLFVASTPAASSWPSGAICSCPGGCT